MQGFQPANYLGVEVAKVLLEKVANRLSKFFQWIAKGYEGHPPCHG